MPTSPAIRLQPSSVHGARPSNGTTRSSRARFAADNDDDEDGQDYQDHDTKDGSLAPGQQQQQQQATTRSNTNTVKFQTRPRGNTGDSTNSVNYPTFAAYRQSQQGDFDSFTQRFKRAFLSQQQQQQEEIERQKQLQEQGLDSTGGPIHLQSLAASGGGSTGRNSVDGSDLLSPPLNASTTTETRPTASRSRSSSSAAASILGDFAERIKSGSLFSRSSTNLPAPVRSMTDPQPQPQPLAAESRSRLSLSSRPKSRLGVDDGASSMAFEDGIEIVVTGEDPESPTSRIVSNGDETRG